jgi:DNA polymerase-3 subunit beta
MKFSIDREELSRALRIVSGVIERKQQQSPSLSSVFLTLTDNGLEVVATDQEIELIATVQPNEVLRTGSALIPCRKLNDICRVLPEKAEIVIDSTAEKTLIKAGQSKFALSALSSKQFPKLGDFVGQHNFSVSRFVFTRLLEKTAFAMAEQDVRYFLNGTLLEVGMDFLRAVAADGHRLATQTMSFDGADIAPIKIIIPRKGVLEILRVLGAGRTDTATIILGNNNFRVLCDGLSVTTALLGGRYPDYEKLVSLQGDKVVRGQREQLKEALHRASALLSEKFKGVRLRLSQGWMQILAYNPEKDEVEENLAVDFDGAEVELGFNAKYLLDFLSSAVADTVKMTFSEPNGSVMLEEQDGSQGKCIVMPMRM